MIDKLVLVLEDVSEKVPYFPNEFSWWLKYVIVVIVAYYISWQGNYNFWVYLNIDFNHDWQGYLMTALLLSGGSSLVKVGFSIIDTIPNSVKNITVAAKKMIPEKDNKK